MSCLRLTDSHGKVVQYSVWAESAILHWYIIWWRGRDNEDHRVVMLLVIRGVKAKQKLESRWRTEPKHWYHPQARVSICICKFHLLITKLWSCSEEFCNFSAFPKKRLKVLAVAVRCFQVSRSCSLMFSSFAKPSGQAGRPQIMRSANKKSRSLLGAVLSLR